MQRAQLGDVVKHRLGDHSHHTRLDRSRCHQACAAAEGRDFAGDPIYLAGDGFVFIVRIFVQQLLDRRAGYRDEVDSAGGQLGFDQRR